MIEHYGLPEDALELVAAARHFYRMSAARTETIDFDDMVLLPLLLDLPIAYRKDIVFLDEAQDTSRARRALVKMFLKPHGRLMIVGDDRQAIMGFAGASANALDELVEEMDATVLPLTTTWRCPKKVVALAQELVPDIEAAEHAAQGVVSTVSGFPPADEMRPTDAILCRNTAPLVKRAYALIRDGVACKVEGRDIGAGLIKMLGKWKEITTITPYLDRLAQWKEHEVRRALANGADERIPEICDRADTLRVVCDAVSENHKEELSDVRDFVAGLFADDVKGMGMTTLATMHRSKGREWQRTMLLDYHYYCPSPYARKEWQMRQEENLMYVGITRAKEELTFVRTQEPRPRYRGTEDNGK
jgi:superfamily I DNA/RNA helicase